MCSRSHLSDSLWMELNQSTYSKRPTHNTNPGTLTGKSNFKPTILIQTEISLLLLTFSLSFTTYTSQQLVPYLTGLLQTPQLYINTTYFQKKQTLIGSLLTLNLLDKICFVATRIWLPLGPPTFSNQNQFRSTQLSRICVLECKENQI